MTVEHSYRPNIEGDPYCRHCGHEPWMAAADCPGPHVAELMMPSAQALSALPTVTSGWAWDLKIDTGDFRVWLARTDMADGEPFGRTVYVEEHADGGWQDLGHYDGDDPPRGLPGCTPHAFRGEVPSCSKCGDAGVVTVLVAGPDQNGNYDGEEIPCPACT